MSSAFHIRKNSGLRSAHHAVDPTLGIVQRPAAAGHDLLQRKAGHCPCGGGCPRCQAASQSNLQIGPPDDRYEREADAVADRVMRMANPGTGSITPAISALQRLCASCEADDDGPLVQAKPDAPAASPQDHGPTAPPSVQDALNATGLALAPETRAYFEPRFGRDFSAVRVHTDALAAQSARAVQAQAYTVGHDIMFSAGRFAPGTPEGRRLLAHELTHVVQQSTSGDDGVVHRACLPTEECPKPGETGTGTAAEFGLDVAAEEAPQRQELKEKLPPKKPKSGTHGGRAERLTSLAREHVPEDLKLIHGIFIDEAISKRVGARIISCAAWVQQNLPESTPVPEFEGATHRCVFVSKEYESEAADYARGSSTVGGKSREIWLIDMKTILTHEATHERFLAAKFPFQKSGLCSRDVLRSELSEMAAKISEFPHVVNNVEKRTQWFKHQATTHGENLPGTIRAIRCHCECEDADALIRAGFELASASWSEDLKTQFHAHMKRGEGASHDLYWPYELPPRTGEVGRHEISLLGGAGLTLSDKQAVALLSYRLVLKQWAEGRLRLTGGAQANLAGLLTAAPRELGAAVIGVQYVSTPKATEKFFGGVTGRIETGAGVGDFSLTPAGGGDPSSVRSGDFILQVGAGAQFFLPGLTSLQPASLEATYRLAQPIGTEAERIHVVGLQVVLPL